MAHGFPFMLADIFKKNNSFMWQDYVNPYFLWNNSRWAFLTIDRNHKRFLEDSRVELGFSLLALCLLLGKSSVTFVKCKVPRSQCKTSSTKSEFTGAFLKKEKHFFFFHKWKTSYNKNQPKKIIWSLKFSLRFTFIYFSFSRNLNIFLQCILHG